MQMLKISMFVLAAVLSMAVLNNSGIMEQHHAPAINTLNSSSADGITKMNSGASEDSINNQFFSWGSVAGLIDLFKSIGYYALLPGPYLMSIGANIYVAAMVQVLFNTIFLIGIIQILMKFGFGGFTV